MDGLLAVLAGYALPGIAIALVFLLFIPRIGKNPRRNMLRILAHPIPLEIVTAVVAWLMHGGTLVGGMAVVCSMITMAIALSIGIKLFGTIDGNNMYYPGYYKYDPATLHKDWRSPTITSKGVKLR